MGEPPTTPRETPRTGSGCERPPAPFAPRFDRSVSTLTEYRRLREQMSPELPRGLAAHIDRVVALAGVLTRAHGGDETLAVLAAQGHDLLRAIPPAGLLQRAERRGLDVLPEERAQPVLLHGPLAALELAERFAVTDQTVLDAVRWHTTGHPDFGIEAWAVFVADKAEPEKVARWPALARVTDLARTSLPEAALCYLDLRAERLTREGLPSHPLAEQTRAALAQQFGEDSA